MVNYDGTVRNSTDVVLQFKYFADNYDPIKLEKITNYPLTYSNSTIRKKYKYDDLEDKEYWKVYLQDEVIKEMMNVDNYQDILNEEYNNILKNRDLMRTKYYKHINHVNDAMLYMPVNLFRLIPIIAGKFNIHANISDLSPLYIIEKVNELMDNITKYSSIKQMEI